MEGFNKEKSEDLGKVTGFSGIHITPKNDVKMGDVLVKSGQTVNVSLDLDGKITNIEFI